MAQAAAVASSEKNTAQSKASRFADIVAALAWKDLILSSIKINNKWTKLVHCDESRRQLCKCNLCGISQYGVKNIYAHLSGKKHKNKMNEVTELYNPKFTPNTINLVEPLTTTPNNETINSKNSVTKPISTDRSADNKETNSDETTTTQPIVVAQNKSVDDDGSNKNSPSTNDDIIIVQDKSDAATPSVSSEDKSNESEAAPTTQGQDVEIVNEEIEVPNPFSQTNGSGAGGQCKIVCVSLSKLIDCKDEEEDRDSETADVIEISDNENDDTTAKSSNQQEGGGDTNNLNKNSESRSRVQQQQQPHQGPKPSSSNIPTIHRPSQRRLSFSRNNKEELLFISDRIDSKMEKYGFLGVEYVIKVLTRNDFSAPQYECSLCELILMGNEMQRHLLGYNHRLKYCQKHFPTAIRQYQQYMSDVPEHEIYKVMTPVLEKLAIAIEKHHGKYVPYKCYSSELETNRHDIFSKVYSRRHASEKHGPTFTHLLDAEEIRFLVQNRNSLQTSSGMNQGFNVPNYCGYNQPHFQYDMQSFGVGQSYSHNVAPVLDNETHKMMVENFLKETSRNDPNELNSRHHNSKRMASRGTSQERKRLRMYSSERKSVSPLRDGDIWQAYRHMVDIKFNDLEKKYFKYKKDPEQHPRYNEEWQKFWKRRKDELIRSGIDHRSYNYQNEWSIFFKSHMNELYKQNLEEIKIQCRERLYLPMTNDELLDPKYHVVDNDINDISSDDICEVENEERQQQNNYEDREELLNRDNSNNEDHNKSSPDLIHVLRILAALEEHLGSLGPKITDMLSKALLLSKFTPAGIESSFVTRANCNILETCVEKFKGSLYAGLTDTTKRRALNKAIDETDAFLKSVMPKLIEEEQNTMKLSQLSRKLSDVEESRTLSPQKRNFPQRLEIEKPMASNLSQTLQQDGNRQENSTSSLASNQQQLDDLTETEKGELANKLAASLIAKGKGDFNPEQIRKIIDIYFAIISKKGNEIGSSASNSMDEVTQKLLLNTITQSFVNQNSLSNQQSTNSNQQQQQQQYGNINRNENPRGASQQMTNQNQQQQYFNMNMNTNQNPRASTQMLTANQQQLLQQLQKFTNMNSNQNSGNRTNDIERSHQYAASQSNNMTPNMMNNYQQQLNMNMRSSVRGGGGGGGGVPNLTASAATAFPNLMNIRNINMNTTSSEQNLRQNVPSLMNNNNLSKQYSSNNFQSSQSFGGNQGFGGINRGVGAGGGGGGRGGAGSGAFNQQLPSFMSNLNAATQNSNNNNNNWSRMMMNGGNNQPINNSNQLRGRNTENMSNTERQPYWKRN